MPSSDDKERLERVLRGLSEFEESSGISRAPRFGRYDILGRVGEGGSAVVYRARDRELDRQVAIKLLHGGAVMSPVARERFHREARAAAGLSHPNVVTVHDFGEEEGCPYLVMEYIEGHPWVSGPSADLRATARLLEKAARGVAVAHGKGIVHRDLKPGNILVDSHGEPKVADFGLAHWMASTDPLTRTGATMGTPLYMAPEQIEARADDITPRTDVYALGTILYEALTGQVPFPGETMAEITHKILRTEPVRASGPRDLVTICSKAMEKDPERRYPSAAAFADDLSRFLDGRPIEARPPSTLYRSTRWIGRHRTPILAVSTAVLLALLAGLWASRRPPGPLATLSAAQGEVFRLTESGRQPIGEKESLLPGQGLETSGALGRATLRFPDGSSLMLGGDTRLIDLARFEIEGAAGYRLFLVYGLVKAALSGDKLRLSTPHGEALADRGRFTLSSSTETLLEVWEGHLSLRRANDPRTIQIAAGYYAIAAKEKELEAHRLIRTSIEGALLFAEDFEESKDFKQQWMFRETLLPVSTDGRLEINLGAPSPPGERPFSARTTLHTIQVFANPIRVSVDVELTHEPRSALVALRLHGKNPANTINADLSEGRYFLSAGGTTQVVDALRSFPRRERWTVEIDGAHNVRWLVDERELLSVPRKGPDDQFQVILMAAQKDATVPSGSRVFFDNVVVERLPR